MTGIDERSVPAPVDDSHRGSRSATEAVELALYRAFIGGAAMWQIVLLAVDWAGQTTPALRGWIVVVALATLAAAVLALIDRAPPLLVALGTDVMVVLLYAGVVTRGNAAHLAAVWTCMLGVFIPAFVARARVAIPFTAVGWVVVLVIVGIVQPEWSPAVPIALGFATAWGAVGANVAVRYLRRMSLTIDQDAAAATEERSAVLAAELAAMDAAEDARTMHDTVINTLGAIADAGSVLPDRDAIRTRCSKDLDRIRTIVGSEPALGDPSHLDAIPAALGMSVDVAGIPVAQVRSLIDGLPERVATALYGMVWEALLNANKHSHAEHIGLRFARSGDSLEVAVVDDGVGFDERLRPGRGLDESIFARAAEVGVRVDLSSTPGDGTVLRFRCLVSDASAGTDEDPAVLEATRTLSATRRIETIRRTVCWAWALGMIGASALTAVRNGQGAYTHDYSMLAAMAVLSFVSWRATRGQRDLPLHIAGLLIVSVPAAFVASFAAVDFGRGAVAGWQTLGMTAPIVVLLLTGRTLVPYLLSVLALAVTVLVTGLATLQRSPDVVAVVPVGAAPAFLLAAGFYIFQRATQVILERSVALERAAFVARVRHSAGLAAARARERWRSAGLRGTAHLLDQIANGDLDPRDPEVQATCGMHEQYLRNVCMLSPRAIHLGPWLGEALFEARARSVRLGVRTSDVDVSDAEDAGRLGALVLDAVGVTPAGSTLTVGVFPLQSRGVLTLVGSETPLAEIADAWRVPEGWDLHRQKTGEEEFVEVSWPMARVRTPGARKQGDRGIESHRLLHV